MDYRGRKYYLVQFPYDYMDDIILFIKGTFPHSKIHHLPDNKTTPYWASKIMISCKYNDSETLENMLSSFQKLIFRKHKFYYHCNGNKIRKTLQFKELTKEELGQ